MSRPTSCTFRPTSSRAWRRRWPGACSATRRGAWCSTTARSSAFVPEFEATIPFRDGIRRTLELVRRGREPPGGGRDSERGDGPHPRGVRGQVAAGATGRYGGEDPIVTEREKMLRGELYDASDPELVEGRVRARRLTQRLGTLDPADTERARRAAARPSRRARRGLVGRDAVSLRLRDAGPPRRPSVRQHGLHLPRRSADHAWRRRPARDRRFSC